MIKIIKRSFYVGQPSASKSVVVVVLFHANVIGRRGDFELHTIIVVIQLVTESEWLNE